MKINLSLLINFLFSLSLFALINIPSIKIIYSSQIVNIGIFLLLWTIGFFRLIYMDKSKLKISYVRILFLILFTVLWIVLFLVSLLQQTLTISGFLEYTFTYLAVLGVAIFTKKIDIKPLIMIQIIWALILSIQHSTTGISLDRNLGQHYLTLGVPLASGIACAIVLLFYKKMILRQKLLILLFIAIMISAITTLSGRSPILLSILTPTSIILIAFLVEKGFIKRLRTGVLLLFIISTSVIILFNNVSDLWMDRFSRLFQTENEPRYHIYKYYIGVFKNNPLGLGLEDFGTHGYPHNIFLEVGIAGGVIALIIFCIIVFLFAVHIIKAIKIKAYAVSIASLALYLFLTWNLSFDLSSAYIPLAPMVILFVATEKQSVALSNKDKVSNKRVKYSNDIVLSGDITIDSFQKHSLFIN